MRATLVSVFVVSFLSGAQAQVFEEATQGWASVIVKLDVPEYQPEGLLPSRQDRIAQRTTIKTRQAALIAGMDREQIRVSHRYNLIPYVAMEVTRAGLNALKRNPAASLITTDIAGRPTASDLLELAAAAPGKTWQPTAIQTDTSRLVVGADVANANGCDGAGWAVAILDSGVDLDHGAFSGRVISEACYSSNGAGKSSLCPSGVTESIAPGSGEDCRVCTNTGQDITQCDFQPPGQRACPHGSLVAGAAAGNGSAGNGTLVKGVAPEADIISIRVFTRAATSMSSCNGNVFTLGCPWVYASDLMKGIERVAELAETINIAAINISIDMTGTEGGPGNPGGFSAPCDTVSSLSGIKDAIDLTNSLGIPTVAATGNQNNHNRINPPACLTNTISVGYTQDGSLLVRDNVPLPTIVDAIGHDTNRDDFLDFWAPGEWITTAWPNNTTTTERGTSVAAPHVAGAFAALRSKGGTRGIGYYKTLLDSTGVLVTDTRPAVHITKPRIDVGAACLALSLVEVDARVFLEGPYAGGGAMSTGAILQDSLPPIQPFGEPAYSGTVLEYSGIDAVPAFPNGVVDWVLVSLRADTSAATTVAERTALLMTDGWIRDYDGISPVGFLGIDSTDYFLVVRHRNHGDVMSGQTIDFSSGGGTWNFTDAMSKAYTTGPDPMVELDARFVMFGGDINVDLQVTASDFNEWLIQTKAVDVGYQSGDITLDGQVTASDFNIWLTNTKSVMRSQVP